MDNAGYVNNRVETEFNLVVVTRFDKLHGAVRQSIRFQGNGDSNRTSMLETGYYTVLLNILTRHNFNTPFS